MIKAHNIQSIKADVDTLHLTIDGKTYRLSWSDCSPRLARATPAQRKHFEISPAGYGIRWPEIDEDLAITPLIEQAEEHFLPALHQVREKKGKYRTR
ncbi:MAG: hypothetical protein FD146_443 [Anaerolineaceae bacterium]|nr:MAG: hypothetical protein FD146_443 [Anaerolineaceae bacterium]